MAGARMCDTLQLIQYARLATQKLDRVVLDKSHMFASCTKLCAACVHCLSVGMPHSSWLLREGFNPSVLLMRW